MKIKLYLLAAAMFLSAPGSSLFAQVKGDPVLPTHQQLSRIGLERAWWAQAVLNPHRDKVRQVAVDEDMVFVQSTSGVITAFDAETGQHLWAITLGKFDQPSYAAATSEDLILMIVGATMYGVEKKSGKTVWTLILPSQPSTGPSVDEKNAYFGTLDGSLYAYSLRKIRRLSEERRLPQWSNEAFVWKYKVGKEVTSPPITTGRAVNFASRDGSLYSVSAYDSRLFYQLETNKPIVAPLINHENKMFMASEDNSFYAINLVNGKVIWEFTSGLPIRKSPWAIDRDLYILPDRGGMYCLEPTNGDRRWWQPNLTNFIALLGATVAASDVDGNLVMVSRSKGEIIGALPLRRYTVRPGNERTDRIYLSTESGLVVCLRQSGRTFPVYHRYPDRLPLLPEIAPENESEMESTSESSN